MRVGKVGITIFQAKYACVIICNYEIINKWQFLDRNHLVALLISSIFGTMTALENA